MAGQNYPGPHEGEPGWAKGIRRLQGAFADRSVNEAVWLFARIERWCCERTLCALPMAPEVLAQLVGWLSERYTTRTIEHWLTAIDWAHVMNDHPSPKNADVVQLARRAGRRLHGSPARQAHPLNAELRDRILAACPDTFMGSRDRAIISIGYDTLCRRSELVALRIEDLVRLPDGTGRIQVRRSKNDPYAKGQDAFISRRGLGDLDRWLAHMRDSEGPIFRSRYANASQARRKLSAEILGERVQIAARRAGIEPAIVAGLSAHSLRVGAAHDLVLAGRTLMEVMRAGRWHDLDAVARYVRHAPVNVWSEEVGATERLERKVQLLGR
jgi:integrase